MIKATIQEVAKDLKISATTISFVMNGKGDKYKISKKTQKRILDYVEEKGFSPNRLAQSLSSGRSNTIGFVAPELIGLFYGGVGKSIEEEMFDLGYQVFMCSTSYDIDKEIKIVKSMIDRQVDGIVIAARNPKSIDLITNAGVPVVTFDLRLGRADVDSVGIDNEEGAYQLVHEMVSENNYRKVGLISLNPDVDTLKSRIDGYKNACKKHKLPTNDDLTVYLDRNEKNQSLPDQLDALFKQDIDAVFCSNGSACQITYRAMLTHFPEQLSEVKIMGFDHEDYYDLLPHKIATVAQPANKTGSKCVSLLCDQIEKKVSYKREVILPVSLLK
jgi:LacI family transcriptional regulator